MSASANQANRVKEVYLELVSVEDSAAREAVLERLTGSDISLRQQVLSLLHAEEEARTGLLDRVRRVLSGRVSADEVDITQPLSAASDITARIDLDRSLLIGPYKLMEQIGEGGMGVVYVAQQQKPIRRKVALKLIKPGMDSRQIAARFEAERQALAIMNHPHIAKVLDAGTTTSGSPYFVMELVRGIPITEYCDNYKLNLRERLELFAKVCDAVQHAHQKGVIHRDLKPSNILVERDDVSASPKVIDFGVAKATQQPLTDGTVYTGFLQMIGTPLYMSPEQAEFNSQDIDTRSDIYSLGVLLYELLTGSTPFDRETVKRIGLDEMRRMIREVDPARPSDRISTLAEAALSTVSERRRVAPKKLSSFVRGELDWIVLKALEKDRSRRYATANALGADVQRYLRGEAILACPPTMWYRSRKLAVRHKVLLLASTAIVSSLLIGILVSLTQAVRAKAAEQDAEAGWEHERIARVKAQAAKTEAERSKELAKTNEANAYRQQYKAEMPLGLVDLQSGNLQRLFGSLVKHLPVEDREDHRGWEWHYLLSRCQEGKILCEWPSQWRGLESGRPICGYHQL